MNSRDALNVPLFLMSDEDRYRAEAEARWAREATRAGLTPDRGVAVPQNASKGHSSPVSGRCLAVLKVLSDGRYHKTSEFLGPDKGGSEGMRRLRELKTRGYVIERRKINGSSQWEYRLKTEE